MPLVSTRALPVTLFGADGSETEATMPVGTKFYVRATDEETFVDMELEDRKKMPDRGQTVRRWLGIPDRWCLRGGVLRVCSVCGMMICLTNHILMLKWTYTELAPACAETAAEHDYER